MAETNGNKKEIQAEEVAEKVMDKEVDANEQLKEMTDVVEAKEKIEDEKVIMKNLT